MTRIPFHKMHGHGNDFVVIDNLDGTLSLTPETIIQMADRRYGIGCDQLMLMESNPENTDKPILRIFNQDGTKAQACGNGTRCAGALLMQKNNKDSICFAGPVGDLHVWEMQGEFVDYQAVAMGSVCFDWQKIPMAENLESATLKQRLIQEDTPFANQCTDVVAVNIGNPHCVFFCDDAEQSTPEREGALIEEHPLFPEKCNVEFVSIRPDGSLRMRVWERGVGVTLACGSGACASFAAAKKIGLITASQAFIDLDGGRVMIQWNQPQDEITLIGKSSYVFSGLWG